MICEKCGKELEYDEVFCRKCGTEVGSKEAKVLLAKPKKRNRVWLALGILSVTFFGLCLLFILGLAAVWGVMSLCVEFLFTGNTPSVATALSFFDLIGKWASEGNALFVILFITLPIVFALLSLLGFVMDYKINKEEDI